MIGGKPILLIPKAVVSFVNAYTEQAYRQHFVLTYLRNEHLELNTTLVRRYRRRDGTERRYVTKKDVRAHEPEMDKEYLARFTEAHPEVFQSFRQDIAERLASLSDNDLTREDRTAVIEHLITELRAIPPGNANAGRYHRTVTGILELLFYPDLMSPIKEQEILEGRKRIDITFDNAANGGFFMRLHRSDHIPCLYIMVECKNYGREVANPELDQMAGRFSPNRGTVGLIVCREIGNHALFMRRCADTYHDDRGVIIPLTDEDVISGLEALRRGDSRPLDERLTQLFRAIVLR